jgi:hypothetical protein
MRPVGKQIRAILAASEKLGKPATATELFKLAGLDTIPTARCRVCRRAQQYGLMTNEGIYPDKFQAAPGWQKRINQPHISNPKYVAPEPPPRYIPKINSVWALGL